MKCTRTNTAGDAPRSPARASWMLLFGLATVAGIGADGASANEATLPDEILVSGFEQFTLTIDDYLGRCSISVDGAEPTSSPAPITFFEGKVVTLQATAVATFVWRYWTGTDGGDPDTNASTSVAMIGDRMVQACCQTADANTCGPDLTVDKVGQGTGTVTSDIPGIDCGADCGETYPLDTHVVLTASAATGSTFAGWSGGACSGTGTCSVTIDAEYAITATFDTVPPNRVFVTSATYTGNLAGTSGADMACQARAASSGLGGTYVAWLSSSTAGNAKDRLGSARGWVRTDGLPVADQVGDIVTGHLFYPIDLDENQVSVASAAVRTATNATGTFTGNDCSNWTSTTGTAPTAGDASYDGAGFTQAGTVSCGAPARLYCFGIDNAAVVAPPQPANRRLAFLSTGWVPGGGLASADAKCAVDAAAAQLSGSFKALLATSTVAAFGRFATNNVSVARPDGVVVALDSVLASAAGTTYLNAAPTGNAANTQWYSSYGVWSGASTLNAVGSSGTTCNDWTSSSAGASGMIGLSDATKVATWRNYSMLQCNQPLALVCLEQ